LEIENHFTYTNANVTDIKFSPKHISPLKLAATCNDGFVRIFEAENITELNWTLIHEFETHKGGCSSLTWNPYKIDLPMILVGGSANDSTIKLFEFNSQFLRWQFVIKMDVNDGSIRDLSWGVNMGRPFHLIASASNDVRIWKLQLGIDNPNVEYKQISCFKEHESPVKRVEWDVTGTMLASSGVDNGIRLWRSISFVDNWTLFSIIYSE